MKSLFYLIVAGLLSSPATARAQTDFRSLSDAERAILRAEIRAVLQASPEIAAPARGSRPMPEPRDVYAEEIHKDQALIERFADRLFDPSAPGFGPQEARAKLALLVKADCPDCRRAETELRTLAGHHDLRVTLLNIDKNADLAEALQVDQLPFYVMPKMMLRGHMPAPILTRYLQNGTGQ